jgi:hypothetical protein
MKGELVSEFERACEVPRVGFVGEVWGFLLQNKKWWLLPVLMVLCLFGLLVFLSSTGAAPFIYTLF